MLALACSESDRPTRAAVPTPTVDAVPTATPVGSSDFVWPEWARHARIAGAFFDPDEPTDIPALAAELASENVSVVIADSPWGWSYAAWVDDTEFARVETTVRAAVAALHARGLRVVMYLTGLEVTSSPGRNPANEHADWAQISLAGQPIVFDDIANADEHWLDEGEWDMWLSPCTGYRDLTLKRVRQVVEVGVDGLWVDTVYLQHAIGQHEDLWPSTDPCSIAAFRNATGLDVPGIENWDDPTWLRWMVWRHEPMTEFMTAIRDAARAVNPEVVVFEENWNLDTAGATYYANDPAAYAALPDLSTGHEISTVDDRVDLGGTGMANATLEQWLAFRTMLGFARAADRGKPSWILTYGYQPRDARQLAGLALASGSNFYETRGPSMADTVSSEARRDLFAWVAQHVRDVYDAAPLADVGLVYSPRNRDLLDSGSGDFYDAADSVHFRAYRTYGQGLHEAHVPFEVVLDTDLTGLSAFPVLVLPEVQAVGAELVAALRAHTGKLIVIGDSGQYDDWLNDWPENPLANLPQTWFAAVTPEALAAAQTNALSTDAPATVQLAVRRTGDQSTLVVTNLASAVAPALQVSWRETTATGITSATFTRPDAAEVDLTSNVTLGAQRVNVAVPAGLASTGLVVVRYKTGTVPAVAGLLGASLLLVGLGAMSRACRPHGKRGRHAPWRRPLAHLTGRLLDCQRFASGGDLVQLHFALDRHRVERAPDEDD